MLIPISVIQRREPLTSGPINSVATINATLTANTISALRRICRGDMKETPIMTRKDGSRNSTWWPKKWNGSSPILAATGGLAASDSTTPLRISAMIAPSSGRSTVHHHSDSGVRSSREIMGIPHGHPLGQGIAHWSPIRVSEGLRESLSFEMGEGGAPKRGRHTPRKRGTQYAGAWVI